jgi:hypothetical protein
MAVLLSACTVHMSETTEPKPREQDRNVRPAAPLVIRGERPPAERPRAVVDDEGHIERPAAKLETVAAPREEPEPEPAENRQGKNPTPKEMQDAVRMYVLEHAREPGSVTFIEWHPIVKNRKGYMIRCRYRTDGGSFGLIEEEKSFFLNRRGSVYRTGASAQAGGS